MIVLNTTTRQLELDLASSSSTPLDITVVFKDIRTDGEQDAFGTQLSTSNGTSDVVICSAPVAGVLRLIETIAVSNATNSADEIVRIYYDESGTEYDIITATLSGGDQLFYEDE
ncbi:MAG: hypothetical protein MN733_27750 [Nitrososphaera sp.]|nr:hypothetical protein [Nitrososphaera sp.]